MDEPLRVMVVDDHPLFREGLKTLIDHSPDYRVVAEAGSGREAFEVVEEARPDIVLVDITMPGMNGIQLIREMRASEPQARFMVISMHSNVDYIVEAFRAGATGYMVKDSAGEGLFKGLATVARGEIFLDESLSNEVVIKLLAGKGDDHHDSAYKSLTSREQEVMRLLAEGMCTREVAQQLYISPKTVENHRANLMKKLGLQNSVELVRYAARLGIIDVESWIDHGVS